MKFKDLIKQPEQIDESAQAKLDAITAINKLLASADLSTLKRVVKMLQSGSETQE